MDRPDAQLSLMDAAVNERRICLNQSVLDFMAERITPQSFVLEFGSGWSSRWFAERCGRLISIETSPEWIETVRQDLAGVVCDWSVRLLMHPAEEMLMDVVDADLALVDCVELYRDVSARLAWPRLRVGGWLVLDDTQREMHAGIVEWLNGQALAHRLEWDESDVETAKTRIALAWQKG